MGRFLKQFGLFFVLLLVACLIVFGIQTWNIRKKANFKFLKEYKYLMIGHSHPECAYNDSLISNFKNISDSGEAYFYTYYKLIEVLKDNPSIEIVMIEFTNNQVDSAMDKWIWGEKSISHFYPKYGAFISLQDQVLLVRKKFGSVLNSFSVLQKRNFLRNVNNDHNYIDHIGGYVYYEKNAVEEAKLNQERTKKNAPLSSEHSTNIKYLEKIIKLCRQNNKEIVLIRTPQHKYLKMRNNEKKYLNVYAAKFTNIPFIDFNDFNIPDYGYKDLEHLNYKGANIISKAMDSLIQNKIIEKYIFNKEKRIIINK